MSGICGLFNLDGAPVMEADLRGMTRLLERRGPDGTSFLRHGPAGLGFTLLATTPELVLEHQPVEHPETGCVIVADVRLDNRQELLAALNKTRDAGNIGDAGLILAAYLAWGEACVERFLGDFAFAIWDSRKGEIFCARDHLGMRQLIYHHTPGRLFGFATEPRAILSLERVPHRINEARIADFLVNQLEGIDKTSTFFQEVYRLPPGHTLRGTPRDLQVRRYWRPEPVPELHLSSNEEYAEAFLEVFTEAVRCRLRTAGPVGSMLSGGMDSGSVVAVAREIMQNEQRGPLPTFSAVGPDPDSCPETRAILASSAMEGIAPHLLNYEQLEDCLPELKQMGWDLAEPFDCDMTLPRTLYLAASRRGVKVLLDGVGGDVIINYTGTHLARRLKGFHCLAAWHQAQGELAFYNISRRPWREMYLAARTAFTPNALRKVRRQLFNLSRKRLDRIYDETLIDPDFAVGINLAERLEVLDAHWPAGIASSAQEQLWATNHPNLTVGRERYDRLAAACGVEPRDPFMDIRVASFCQSLPESQKLDAKGWPKAVLRHAMSGKLPDSTRWRRGKEHLGGDFTRAVIRPDLKTKIPANDQEWSLVEPYVNTSRLKAHINSGGELMNVDAYYAVHLHAWLKQYHHRPYTL